MYYKSGTKIMEGKKKFCVQQLTKRVSFTEKVERKVSKSTELPTSNLQK